MALSWKAAGHTGAGSARCDTSDRLQTIAGIHIVASDALHACHMAFACGFAHPEILISIQALRTLQG